MGFYTGIVLTWFILEPAQNLGSSIGITCGGVAQTISQFLGYFAKAGEFKSQRELLSLEDEQDKYLTIHIISMINLFVFACGIPALMRLGEVIGYIFLLPLITDNWVAGSLILHCTAQAQYQGVENNSYFFNYSNCFFHE